MALSPENKIPTLSNRWAMHDSLLQCGPLIYKLRLRSLESSLSSGEFSLPSPDILGVPTKDALIAYEQQ